jgi:putative nucleotidyltransferase with HDIG domain
VSAKELSGALDAAAVVTAAREALGAPADVWIVGGALRDAALGRPLTDLDLVTSAEPERVARAIAGESRAAVFSLSEEFATWRVAARNGAWNVDVAALRGESLEADLGARDFTVNAVAAPLGGGDPIDPRGGMADLDAAILRAVSDRSFADDPLRLMRGARLGAELGLEPDPETVSLAQGEAARAAEPAGERQFAELRGMITGGDPLRALELLDRLGATATILPELEALKGVEQNPYHHLDVHGHTLAVLEQALELEQQERLGELFGDRAAEVAGVLKETVADELTRSGALRFAALLHDIGKPATRTVNEEGRVLFLGHDRVGAEMVGEVCTRLRTSRRLREQLTAMTTDHLVLGFLVHERPLPRRRVYDYLARTDPIPVDTTLLTVADRLATQGPKTRAEAVEAHLDLARELIPDALAWQREGPPASPVGADELAEAGVAPGPEMGRILAELSAAAFSGEVSGREDALALARRLAGG